MDRIISHLHTVFAHSPEAAIFLSLALGYWVGKFRLGSFQLGGVAGSLLAAVLVSQVGVHVDDGVKNILFALFIYAVGYESGPRFFRSLNRDAFKEILLAAMLAVTGLLTVLATARLFGFDKGLAAGIAAGGLTQSAIIGTAGDALARLGLGEQQTNVAVGYAVTYVFGSFGTILLCTTLLPRFMGRSIHDDAIKAEAAASHSLSIMQDGQAPPLPDLVGRQYRLRAGRGQSVAELEAENGQRLTIEKIKRAGAIMTPAQDTILRTGDVILIVGRRDAVLNAAPSFGTEVYDNDDMRLVMQERDIVVADPALDGKTIQDIRAGTDKQVRHGVYLMGIRRDGSLMPVAPGTTLRRGDVITLYGSEDDIRRVTMFTGHALAKSDKTDFVYLGLGILVGLLAGIVSVRLFNLPVTLGSGGGCLLSGLVFGWFRARTRSFGFIPTGAVQLLKDLGLAGFVVVVGLQSGLQAVHTVAENGWSIFAAGAIVTVVPFVLTMLLGRYVLKYSNTAIFAGALSGSRSANPAFGEVLNAAGNAVPTVPFAITYALANVFLTLLGPLIVALA